METIMILSAHNDDHVIGAGGTIAKYVKDGRNVVIVVFSYGELSHPHYQRKVIVETRVRESQSANKVLGISEEYYLGLNEGKFQKEIEERHFEKKIKQMIRKKKPVMIFTHSTDDVHPDHRAVYNFTMNLLEKMRYRCDVYCFNVWNLFINIRQRNSPKLVVDITDSFKKKVEAFKCHKSQKMVVMALMWYIHLIAFINGLRNGHKLAEVFYKVR